MKSSRTRRGQRDETRASQTYARMLPELEALAAKDLVAINLDIPTAVAMTRRALPDILALRREIREQLPNLDLAALNKLEDYALALQHAHAQYLRTARPALALEPAIEEGTALRESLLMDAKVLAHRGHIDAGRLKELKGTTGYKNLAMDLAALVSVLTERWAKLEGRTSVERADLERASELSQRLLHLVGLREKIPALVAAAADMRVRAFTLMVRAYDDARRAIIFLRWKVGDADRIAPSLYRGRGGKGGRRIEQVRAVGAADGTS